MLATAAHLAPIDWWIIAASIALSLVIGIVLSRRARRSVREYFTSGGSTPWWLLGTSMVATTFAADTPLALSGWVVTKGLAQNWFWWCQVPAVMLGVFFIARLWRRANLVTDNEFVNLRYSGPAASVLRGFKAVFFAVIFGSIVMGWVNLAMTRIIQLSIPDLPRIAGVDRALLWTYLQTPLSAGLAAPVREALRDGRIDALRLYHEEWRLAGRAERPGIERELEALAARLGVMNAKVEGARKAGAEVREGILAPAEEGVAPAQEGREGILAPAELAPAELERWRVYVAGIEVRAFLEPLGLAEREGELAAMGRALLPPRSDGQLAMPPALVALQAVCASVAGANRLKILLLLFGIVVTYTVISGLWGVLVTDFIQFWVAMAGCIVLAVLAVQRVGGLDEMLAQMGVIYSEERARAMLSMVPVADAGRLGLMPVSHFVVFALLSWYVVQFTDGGSYLAQRMFAARNERHAALGYLWYGIANFCLRFWPWVLVGMVAAVMYPYLPDPLTGERPPASVAEEGYVRVMLAVLPAGLLGLMLAAFLAAYMSTISTQLNLGASYLLNDLYRPFVRRGASERHYVLVGQAATLLMAALGLVVSLLHETIAGAWFFLGTLSAGIGAIYLLRWFWWRINAWSEIVCLAVLLVCAMLLKLVPWVHGVQREYPLDLLYLVPISVGAALVATYLTKPVDRERLIAFARQVQPGGPGWRRIEEEIRQEDPAFRSRSPIHWRSAWRWLLAVAAIYAFLFGTGLLLLGDAFRSPGLLPRRTLGIVLMGAGVVLGWLVARTFSERRWGEGAG